MRGAIPPLPQYVFTKWFFFKQRDEFTFTFTAKKQLNRKRIDTTLTVTDIRVIYENSVRPVTCKLHGHHRRKKMFARKRDIRHFILSVLNLLKPVMMWISTRKLETKYRIQLCDSELMKLPIDGKLLHRLFETSVERADIEKMLHCATYI
jgi:hypothetical protein